MSKPNLEVITEGYFEGLMVLDLPAIRRLCHYAACTLKFWPTLAELRELGRVTTHEMVAAHNAHEVATERYLEDRAARDRAERVAHEAWLDTQLRERRAARLLCAEERNPPKSDPDDLAYVPTVNAAERKALLRAQAEAIAAGRTPEEIQALLNQVWADKTMPGTGEPS